MGGDGGGGREGRRRRRWKGGGWRGRARRSVMTFLNLTKLDLISFTFALSNGLLVCINYFRDMLVIPLFVLCQAILILVDFLKKIVLCQATWIYIEFLGSSKCIGKLNSTAHNLR
jgi:hypothetical protein